MALGVRSYGNSLLVQNLYNADNLPNTIPEIKGFASRILNPSIMCVEADCETTIGRVLPIPQSDVLGYIALDTDAPIDNDYVNSLLSQGIYQVRTRDTSTCISEGGFCSRCGRGFFARIGQESAPEVGKRSRLPGETRSYQTYIANKYSGALMGFAPLAADPIPAVDLLWDGLTNHDELNYLIKLMGAQFNVNRDELAYLFSVEGILEKSLLLIGMYGVYANVVK